MSYRLPLACQSTLTLMRKKTLFYRNIHGLLQAKNPQEAHEYYGNVDCRDSAVVWEP